MRLSLSALLVILCCSAAMAVALAPGANDVVILSSTGLNATPQVVHGTVEFKAIPPASAKVANVTIFLDGKDIGPTWNDEIGVYEAKFDTTTVADGLHRVEAVGGAAESNRPAWGAIKTIDVRNKQPADSASVEFQTTDARVELRIRGTRFKIGQPIPYVVKVTNLSKQELPHADCGAAYKRLFPGHTIEVLDSAGNAAPRPSQMPHDIDDIMCGIAKLAPGASIEFKGYLNQWAILSSPGKYKISASWFPDVPMKHLVEMPKSDAVGIKIVAASQRDRDAFLKDASKRLSTAIAAGKNEDAVDAIWLLAYTLDDRAVPLLKEIASGKNEAIRWEAAAALMYIGSPAAKADLTEATGNKL